MSIDPSRLDIRLLIRDDGADYQALRLESLQINPEAFLSTFEAEEKLHESAFEDHLDWAYHPPAFGYFGIFVDEKLVGYVQASKNYLEKQKHITSLNNLYISKDFRKQGLATILINFVLQMLQGHEGIQSAFLSCTAKNRQAYQLYKKLGFQRFAVRRDAILFNGEYDDEIEMVKFLQPLK
jgi:RimJ/RimL family protein N-acetyltransferase